MSMSTVGRMHAEMSRVAADFDHDASAKVLILTHTDGVREAGRSDATIVQWLKEVADADRVRDGVGDRSAAVFEGGDTAFEARRIVDGMLECRKPIISVVTGPSAGLGGTFLLLAVVVVAGRSAVFGDTHVRRGLGAGDGAQVIWPLLVGVNRAKYYLMTGDTIDAEEAER